MLPEACIKRVTKEEAKRAKSNHTLKMMLHKYHHKRVVSWTRANVARKKQFVWDALLITISGDREKSAIWRLDEYDCFCGCICASNSSDAISELPFRCGIWFWFLCLTGSFNEGLRSHNPTQASVPRIILGHLTDPSGLSLRPSITFGAAASADGATARTCRTSGAQRNGRAYRTGTALQGEGCGGFLQSGKGQVLQKIRVIKRSDATRFEPTQYDLVCHWLRRVCNKANQDPNHKTGTSKSPNSLSISPIV